MPSTFQYAGARPRYFAPRRKFAGARRKVRKVVPKSRVRIPAAVRSTYIKARMNRNPALQANAMAYMTAYRGTYYKKPKPQPIDGVGLSRKYYWKQSTLTKQTIKPHLLIPFSIDRLSAVKQEAPNGVTDSNFFPGYFTIGKGISAGTGNTYTQPCYVFDLTKVTNVNTADIVCKQLRLDDAGLPTWDDRPTLSQGGATLASSQYIYENGTAGYGTLAAPSVAKIQAAWYDIRLKLYGARKQSVTYDVMLVRFKDSAMVPDSYPLGSSDPESRNIAFYQQIAKAYTVNSIVPGTYNWQRHVHILKKQRIKLDPSMSDDLDVNPDSMDLRWFVRDMRIRNYTERVNKYGQDVGIDGLAWLQNSQTSTTNNPNARSRLFLFVLATDMTSTQATNDDMDDTPSFDAIIRRKLFYYGPATSATT